MDILQSDGRQILTTLLKYLHYGRPQDADGWMDTEITENGK